MKVQVTIPSNTSKQTKQPINAIATPASKRSSAVKHSSPKRQVSSLSSNHGSLGTQHSSPYKQQTHQSRTTNSSQNTNSQHQIVDKQSFSTNNTSFQDKEIQILKEQVEQLKTTLKDAQDKEVQQKLVYDQLIQSLHQNQENSSISENYNSVDMIDINLLHDLNASNLNELRLQKENELKTKIRTLEFQLEEANKNLSQTQNNYKLLQKEYDFSQKDHQTIMNHLRLDNQRLKESLQNEKDRSTNELSIAIEDRMERENQNIRDLQTKFEFQIEEMRHLNLREKASLEEECQRLKSELKFLRLEHSELISNTNVEKQITFLHEEYLSEIQALNQQLALKQQETCLLLESMDREKMQLIERIKQMESELEKTKDSQSKIKQENQKKNAEMKEKLEKAFHQLTANDEAANELHTLRSQIKEMQSKIEVKQTPTMNKNEKFESFSINPDDIQIKIISDEQVQNIKRVETIAKDLQSQIGLLMSENQKIRKELQQTLTQARSMSPQASVRKIDTYHLEDKLEKTQVTHKKRQRNKQGFASPQIQSRKQNLINQDHQQSTKPRKVKGFLESQRINKNLQLNEPSSNNTVIQDYNLHTNKSNQNSPSNQPMTMSQLNSGGVSARLFDHCAGSKVSGKKLYFQKNMQAMGNDMSAFTLNTTNMTTDYTALGQSGVLGNMSHRQISKKDMSQSLSSNQLLIASPMNSQTIVFQKMQSHIDSIKCANCLQEYPFEEFMNHPQYCMIQPPGGLEMSKQKMTGHEQLQSISPIKSRNKSQGLANQNSDPKNKQKKSMVFERIQQPREYDSYLDLNEDYSTDHGGYRSNYGGNIVGGQLGNNMIAQRPSFLSSVDYNSFMDKSVPFMRKQESSNSPDIHDKQQNVVYGKQLKHIKQLEERAKFFENIFRQAQENVHKLNGDLRKKDLENEKLILDLKQTKIHIALLEETSAQKEIILKSEINNLRQQQKQKGIQPEITVKLNQTNVSCFNIGVSSIANNHEIKIEPQSLLQKATQDQKIQVQGTTLKTPQVFKQKLNDFTKDPIYQETDPSFGDLKAGLKNYKQDDFRAPPKRLRSMDKDQCISTATQSLNGYPIHHGYSQSFHHQGVDNPQISQDVHPDGLPHFGPSISKQISIDSGRKHPQMPYASKLQRGLGSPKMLTTRQSPQNQISMR
ncbi:UNKNOWN [Stylonychia lemnae]|uniref:Uncharacterized protein n=1 Tax=Stylonychia lemnae TaxID=5949 RepID=A0A078B3B4_STYLE|nr:UNKNOWN [Stylonychia lemnae]|eukprot:CDW88929.1 UNKNOWN [Stylonychia lemnae]